MFTRKVVIFAIIIFIFSVGLRLWNLNIVGRWWDEHWYLGKGYAVVELIKKGEFSNPFWYTGGADHPPLSSYFYGLAAYNDLVSFDPKGISELSYVLDMPKGVAHFRYDVTATRLVSVIVSSLAVLLVFLIGARYFSLFVGFVSAMILAMLPHLLGLSQLVTLESWIVFTFTLCVFLYLLYLETGKMSFLILTGVATGLTFLVKQSNLLIIIFYITTYFVWKKTQNNKYISLKHYVTLGFITLITTIVLYPSAWLNLPQYTLSNYDLWINDKGRVPELMFTFHEGRSFFYIVSFLVTTPLIILLLNFVGIGVSWRKRKKWIYLAILIWFIVPFLMSFFHLRQHMVRYIIQFYAPLSLLAAIGLEYLLIHITKSRIVKYSFIAPLFAYLMIILFSITPYYLSYFNELVGGTKNVYEKKYFFIGWFGEGLRGPGKYLEVHAPQKTVIGMALNPEQTLYRTNNLIYETFDEKKKYKYVVVNYFNVIRSGFDRSILDKDYEIVYTEKADGADIAWVYKHK